MARLANVGFEFNTTTAGMETTNVSVSAPTIQGTTKRSGSYALQITSLAGLTPKYVGSTFSSSASSTDTFYIRVYFYYSTAPSADNCVIQLNIFSPTPSPSNAGIILTSAGALKLMSSSSTQIGSTSSALTTNTWYRIEIESDKNTGSSDTVLRARIDGVEFAGASNLSIIQSAQSVIVGGNLYSENQTTGNWYFDDIAVNDQNGTAQNSYPGSGKLVLALPTGAGDNAATTGIYSYINEIPPSDTATSGSTMIELDTNTTIGDYNATDSSTLVIDSADTISLVSVYGRVREEASGASNYTLRLKSAASGTTVTNSSVDAGNTTVRTNPNGTTDFGNMFMSYTDPTTTVAWTPTGTNSIDNMQIGAATTDGNPDTWVLWLGAYIEYVAYVAPPSTAVKDMLGSGILPFAR